MSDRLAELLRQRAQLQEQLAQLDRQIAAAASAMAPELPPSAPSASKIPSVPVVITDPDAIIGQYASDSNRLKTDVRKGCLLYAALALLLLILGIAGLLRFSRH